MAIFWLGRLTKIVIAFIKILINVLMQALIRQLGLPRRYVRKLPSLPQQLRQTLEALGATFIKMGQLMAMRPDLLPSEYISELSNLLDDVPPFSTPEAIKVIEEELGKQITDIFESIGDEVEAAASFGQVYKANLKEGTCVAVKVQRPGLAKVVETDIKILTLFVNLIELSGVMMRVRLKPLLEDFAQWTREELDYLVEATYAERMRLQSINNPAEKIPVVYWEYTTRKVLVLEFLEGVWVTEILEILNNKDCDATGKLKRQAVNLRQVARNIFFNGLHQMLGGDLFHSDPHAANMVVMENNVIGYVDFGIIGQPDEKFRDIQISLLQALQQGRLDRFFQAFMRLLSPPPSNVDLDAFRLQIKKNVRMWLNASYNPKATLRERSSAWLFTQNLSTTREYGLSFSEIAVRYYRALSVAELIVLRLDPAFDIRQGIRTFFATQAVAELHKASTPERYIKSWIAFRWLLLNLPDVMAEISEYIEQSQITVTSSVSSVKMLLSQVFKVLAIGGAACLFLIPGLNYIFPQLYSEIFPVNWYIIVLPLLALVLFWAWFSRFLYLKSVR